MSQKKIFSLLADLLEYPSAITPVRAREAAAVLETLAPAAKRQIDDFAAFCRTGGLRQLEEIYTGTFDLEARCPPYVGHHLFGEDRIRGTFMVRLKNHYQGRVSTEDELPDHICLMLRALDVDAVDEEIRDLKECCVVPAVRKMIGLLEKDDNPYLSVLKGLLLVLETNC